MQYQHIVPARFIARPNRFIAHAEVDSEVVVAHVKNTGRCKELLVPGARVYLEHAPHPGRKTAYSLISVEKGNRLINMDSQAPNQVVAEALAAGWMPPQLPGPATEIRRESVYGSSRIDFRFTAAQTPVLMEVKGVTLEEDGLALFRDAPTERGVKHLRHLIKAKSEGFAAVALFVIQMPDIRAFSPNDRTHPAFGDALREAARAGVFVTAATCKVTPGSLCLDEAVEVRL